MTVSNLASPLLASAPGRTATQKLGKAPPSGAERAARWAVSAAVGLGVSLAAGCATGGNRVGDDYEKPRYEVAEAAQAGAEDAEVQVEVRRYEPYVVAAVTIDEEDFDDATNAGFRVLAGYIFGDNEPEASVAMTSPVTAQPVARADEKKDADGEEIAMTSPVAAQPADGGWEITFMMPSEYSLDSLPAPNDDRIRFEEKPEMCVAAIGFSGFTTDDKIRTHSERLNAWMAKRGMEPQGPLTVAQYDDPFTFPWNRWTEVQATVASDACPTPS